MKKFFLFLLLVPAMLVQAQTEISCTQARSYASGVSGNNVLYNDGEVFVVRGYVTSIQIAWSSQYKNVSFWMADTQNGGKVIEAFRCVAETEADVPTVGDLVDVTGKLTKYNSTPQIAEGCTYQLVSSGIPPVNLGDKTIADFLAMKNTKDTCILTGVVANIVMDQTDPTLYNVYGNFDLVELGDPSVKVYIYGLLTPEKQSKQFRTMGVDAGDTLTIKALYSEYNNNPQVPSGIYVSHRDYVEPTSDPIDSTKTVVDFETDFAQGWDGWIGKTLTFTNPFYVIEVNTGNWDSLLISPERLQIADEIAAQLHNGDSTAYKAIEARNNTLKIGLKSSTAYFKSDSIRCGAIVPSLHATVVGERSLRLNEKLVLENNVGPTIPPAMPTASLVVCGTNIENYFSSYGSGSNGAQTEEQFIAQTAKIAGALININADIYAICEIECNTTAPATLVAKMNELAGSDAFAFVNNGLEDASNQASVGFIYRKSKVALTDKPAYFPYSTDYMTWYRRLIIREFMEISSGEKFAVSVNHFKSKVSAWQTTQNYNVSNLVNGLNDIVNNDVFATDRILILGDFNSYTHEKTDQTVISAGYQDVLPHSNPLTDYSYVFKGETGYLDRAFASNALVEYIVDVQPYHLNTDASKRLGYKYTVDSKYALYRYADHDPILVGLQFDKTVTTTENVTIEPNAQKILRNGQIVIIRSGVEYTVTGQRLY